MGFDRDAYATRIKSLRKKSGLTQEQLAEKINVTSTYIVKIENSQRTGSIEFSVELAKCFGVSLDYLLLGEEVGNKKQVLQRVIRSSKPEVDGKFIPMGEDVLKTKSSFRTLPLIPAVENLLLEEKEKQEMFRRLFKKSYCRDYLDYICVDQCGNLLRPKLCDRTLRVDHPEV